MSYDRRVFTKYLLTTSAVIALPTSLMAAVRRVPDLVIDALQWSDDAGANWHNDPVPEGSSLLFQATVRNAGDAPIAIPKPLEVSFLVEGEEVDAAEQTVGLAAGESLTLTGAQLWPAAPGNHRVTARVDPADLVRGEGSEANNEFTMTLSVVAADMALLAVAAPDKERCELSEEQLRWSRQPKGLSELPTWKEDEQVRMIGRMVREDKVPPATAALHAKRAVLDRIDMTMDEAHALMAVAATFAAAQDADADNAITRALIGGSAIAAAVIAGEAWADTPTTREQAIGLGMAIAKMAAIGVGILASGGSMLGFAAVAVDQMLGANLFPSGEVAATTKVGYTASTGNPIGVTPLPSTVGTVSNANFAGTTSTKAAQAAKLYGWSTRFYKNFANVVVNGNGGMIHDYNQHANRLRSQFLMYVGAMRWADAWTLSLWIRNFRDYLGNNLFGGHMDTADPGCFGGLFYSHAVGPKCFGGPITAQPLLTELYVACKHAGFRNYPLSVSGHGVNLGVLHHSSSLGLPGNLMPTPDNGDAFAPVSRDGIFTVVDYAKKTASQVPGLFVADAIDSACLLAKARAAVGRSIAVPTWAAIIYRVYKAFKENGWDINPLTDDVYNWMLGRGLPDTTRNGVIDMIMDILAGGVTPGARRWFVNQLLGAMDRGEGGPNLIVQVQVYQTTGTGAYSSLTPPSAQEYNQVINIYSKWKRGMVPVGRTIRVNTATGNIEHT